MFFVDQSMLGVMSVFAALLSRSSCFSLQLISRGGICCSHRVKCKYVVVLSGSSMSDIYPDLDQS